MGTTDDFFRQILSHAPSQGTLLLVLKKIKEEGRPNEVIKECLNALSAYPDDIRLRTLLAESYLEAGFIGQAEAELDRVTSDIDDLSSAYRLKAEIYMRQKRDKHAFEALKCYLAHNPDDQEALDLFDSIKPAGEELPREAAERPDDVDRTAGEEEIFTELATPTLAEILYDQGQIHYAIRTYEKVLLDKPDDDAIIKRLAELKTLAAEETGSEVPEEDKPGTKNASMIAVLEAWLARIRESKNAT